jgi:hypothetical protein
LASAVEAAAQKTAAVRAKRKAEVVMDMGWFLGWGGERGPVG